MSIDWTTVGLALFGVAIARGIGLASKVRDRYAKIPEADQDSHRTVFGMVRKVVLHPWELLVTAGMVLAAIAAVILCKAMKIVLTEPASVYLGATAPDLLLRLLKSLIPPLAKEREAAKTQAWDDPAPPVEPPDVGGAGSTLSPAESTRQKRGGRGRSSGSGPKASGGDPRPSGRALVWRLA